jgi:hypothetical protein
MRGCKTHGLAKLCEGRRQLAVDGLEAEVARSADVGVDGALQQWHGDAGDGDDGEQRHLQA